MAQDAAALVAQVAAQRLRTATLEGAVSVTYTLPSQFAASLLVTHMRNGQADTAQAVMLPWVRSWAGVSQATLLGAGVGSDEPAPYAPELLDAYLADRPAVSVALASHMVQAAAAAARGSTDAAKNS